MFFTPEEMRILKRIFKGPVMLVTESGDRVALMIKNGQLEQLNKKILNRKKNRTK